MSKFLLIAEKPSAMRAYRDCYAKHKAEIERKIGGSIDFTALRGHIFRNMEPKEYEEWNRKWRELYDGYLPMIPDVWKIAPIDSAKDVIKDLKGKLKEGYDGIVVATDSDVEGYGIYYMVCRALSLEKYKTLRFYETAQTDKDILNSFLTMEDLFATPRHKNAMNAYVFRSRWDWLIGMNFSTLYTVRYGQLMKVGSVKAPTLKIIYDNCQAIESFREVITYAVKSTLEDDLAAFLVNDSDNNEHVFQQKADAEKVVASLGVKATVESFETKTVQQKAPKLYSLSDLQVDAAKAPLSYKPEKTLEICQKLYEERKILTYPRTSGNYLASGKVPDLPEMVASLSGIPEIASYAKGVQKSDYDRVAKDKNIINDKEVEKSAHDALVPTGERVKWDELSEEEKSVFLLVAKRFLAHFLPVFIEEKSTLILNNEGHRFKADGRKTLQAGFYTLLGKTTTDTVIPPAKKGDSLPVKKSETVERVSQPPKRYSTGSIISAMKNIASQVTDPALKIVMRESEGIGTEATRAGIIGDLEKSGYIETKKNMIYITDAGRGYIESLREKKEDGEFDYGIADPIKVAYWSAKAKEIQLGEKGPGEVLEEFEGYLGETIRKVKASGDPERKTEGPGTPCPVCGKGKVLKGKYGLYCSEYKNGCKLSVPEEIAGKKVSDARKKQILEGKTVKEKGFTSKAGKSFDAGLRLNVETGRVEFVFDNGGKK